MSLRPLPCPFHVAFFLLVLYRESLACSSTGILSLLNKKPFTYDFWKLPEVGLDDATDEAVMLIGGKHCIARKCEESFVRVDKDGVARMKYRTFESHDPTIKFFTKYGFCRRNPKLGPLKLPKFGRSEIPTSTGAVALPDGRVLICGGVSLRPIDAGRFEAWNSTSCWLYLHNSNEIKRMEMFNKLPFEWLGPFTPNQMQLVKFVDVQEELYKRKNSIEEEAAKEGNYHEIPRQDRDRAKKLEKLSKHYRVVILPWPSYTLAFKETKDNRFVQSGGEIITGAVKASPWGPRLVWRRHRLSDMPIGYGSCVVTQPLPSGHVRVHTFGGRELWVDKYLQDKITESKWDSPFYISPHHLNKYPRYFDIKLPSDGNIPNESDEINSTFDPLFVDKLGRVTRPSCSSMKDLITLNRDELDRRLALDKRHLVLEEDRIFHTCHRLPRPHHLNSGNDPLDIILIGGGTAAFFDRQRILNADYDFTPIYRHVTRYDLKPDPSLLEECREPEQDGKGRWIHEDKTFGFGLNIPRTRHASEIIKHSDVLNPNISLHTLFVFGGYSDSLEGGKSTLDSVESLEIGKAENFYLWDNKTDFSEWKFRLPWPLMDITTVKIPVEWLPPDCLEQWKLERKRESLERNKNRYE